MEAKIEGVVNPSRREAAEDNCHLRSKMESKCFSKKELRHNRQQ